MGEKGEGSGECLPPCPPPLKCQILFSGKNKIKKYHHFVVCGISPERGKGSYQLSTSTKTKQSDIMRW